MNHAPQTSEREQSIQNQFSSRAPIYDGSAACYLEFGHDQVARVDIQFMKGEPPRGKLTGPVHDLIADKASFGADIVAGDANAVAIEANQVMVTSEIGNAVLYDPSGIHRDGAVSQGRRQAVVLTYSILERMRTNAAVARTGAYNYAWSANCPAPGGGTLAATDLTNWVGEIKAGLGQGACGSIACNGNLCTISIRWDDSRGTPVPNAPTLTISTVSRL